MLGVETIGVLAHVVLHTLQWADLLGADVWLLGRLEGTVLVEVAVEVLEEIVQLLAVRTLGTVESSDSDPAALGATVDTLLLLDAWLLGVVGA